MIESTYMNVAMMWCSIIVARCSIVRGDTIDDPSTLAFSRGGIRMLQAYVQALSFLFVDRQGSSQFNFDHRTSRIQSEFAEQVLAKSGGQ